MSTMSPITVPSIIARPVDKVWKYYVEPRHITQWNNASPDRHCPRAENDLRVDGRSSSRMEARDGSFGSDFAGTYTAVEPHQRSACRLEDERKVDVRFTKEGNNIRVDVTFDPETQNTLELQRGGWQGILDNFRTHCEAQP